MSWVSWLRYNNEEISNINRTTAYIRNGLANDPRVWVNQDNCDCAAIDEGPYVTPLDDAAPWYVAGRPESGDFLGLILEEIEVSGPWARTVTARGLGGNSLGTQVLRGRTLGFRGSLFAATPQAMDYGKRWLSEVLRSGCDGCGIGDLCFLPACPEGVADFDPFFRTIKRAGLIDGPTEVQLPSPCDLISGVAFQMASEIGYYYADPEVCMEDQVVTAEHCCLVTTDEWIGDATVKIRIQAGGPNRVENLHITMTPTRDSTCPAPEGITPCMDVLASFPAGSELVIDGTERIVEVRQQSSGRVIGGYDALTFDGVFGWPDMGSCTSACVCVDATDATVNANTTVVSIEKFDRET